MTANLSKRLSNEIEHGSRIAGCAHEIWNFSSPAGKVRWARRVQMFIEQLRSGMSVLEVGCGTGALTEELLQQEIDLIAVDISPDLLEVAERRLPSEKGLLHLADAHATDFSENSFDAIVGSSVLHHLELTTALKEFNRLLKPGGFVFFTEPNMLNPQIAIQKNVSFIKKMLGDSPDETAFVSFLMKKSFNRAGFKEVTATPFDFVHPNLPKATIDWVARAGNLLERVPVVKEFAGSLAIFAELE